MSLYAGIVVNNSLRQLDRIFTYKVPEKLINYVSVGYRVKVPFGNSNRLIDGFVIEISDQSDKIENLKDIRKVCDSFPVLTKNDIEIVKFMRRRYLCTYIDAIKVFIPRGLIKGNNFKIKKALVFNKDLSGKYIKEYYIKIIDIVKKNEGVFSKTEFANKFDVSISSINTLIKHDFLKLKEISVSRLDKKIYKNYSKKNLTTEQKYAVDVIKNSNEKMFLIHGVTGSGKTEIYMYLVDYMIKQSKQSIILVPEISLTPQMVERFKGRFGTNITVFHSRLSDGERFEEWMRIKNGEVNVAIGARSAIFLPFDNLGLIVIDEEHENSYKSDSNPKYNAKEIAFFKSKFYDCKVVLGSATPSVETYYASINKNIRLISIKNRVDSLPMPKVEIVDMRDELLNNNKSIFSRKLYEDINEALSRKEQIILFLNRRGFSSFVSCRKCGYVFKCDNCDISLTYHNSGNYLSCHYCGKKFRVQNVCPKCGSKYVKYFGLGTEKVEEEVLKKFPNARTLRMDFDTTRKKNSHENIYKSFKNGEADILIGTQMVAKGLDFKNVTLVGVIAADMSLNLPDYRAQEKTFQIITQVSGRAGRGEKRGKVIVQTYDPNNFSIVCASSNDYERFYKEEISLRYIMQYPPFSKIMLINLSSKNEKQLIDNTNNIGNIIKNKIVIYDKINMLGPSVCSINKIKNNYRWQIIIKGNLNYRIMDEIKTIVYSNVTQSTGVKVSIDINPNSLI